MAKKRYFYVRDVGFDVSEWLSTFEVVKIGEYTW